MTTNPRTPEQTEPVSLSAALPGLARIAAIASIRLVEWTAGAYVRVGSRLVRAAAAGEPAGEVLHQTREELVLYVRELLGMRDDQAVHPAPAPRQDEMIVDADVVDPEEQPTTEWLRERGAELLRRSAELDLEEDAHPAYAQILRNLAPDEARILKLFMENGPQPSVDVRTGGPIGKIKDQLVAPGLNMIGREAGVRHVRRVPQYLNNLYRLGLIWFSREELEDQSRYQVLEAQPEVAEAMDEAGRGRTIRRSIDLTPFGEDFCSVCLPVDRADATALPRRFD